MPERKYDTVIVGAGAAGLTSAAYLARAGQKVLLLEKNDDCGGLVSTFDVKGFKFDAGVRALEDAGIIFPMLKDLGIEIDFVKSLVSVGIGDEVLVIKDISNLEDYRNLLKRFYPNDEQEIDQTMKIIRKIMKHMDILYGLENPVFKDLKRDFNFIFTKLLPWLPKFIFTVGKINKMNMPVEDYLKSFIDNSSLRDIISQHFFRNTPTFFALSYFSLYLDYHYPKGGVGTLAESLHSKVLEFGGTIKTETRIDHILPGEKKLIDQNDDEYYYTDLIWAADLKTFYKICSTDGLKSSIKKKFNLAKENMSQARGGDSIFSLYLMLDEPLETFKNIATGHFFYTPSPIGLGETHRTELNQMLSNWDHITKADALAWLDKFTALNTYEISIPGLKDRSLVPEGKTGMIISFLAEYDLFAKLKASGWYDEFREKMEDQMIQVMTASIYPMLADNIIDRFSFTPLSIQNRVGTSEGAITGWSFEKHVPVINKIQNVAKSVLTPIPSIYKAGQWSFSPAGVPTCILAGKLASEKILK